MQFWLALAAFTAFGLIAPQLGLAEPAASPPAASVPSIEIAARWLRHGTLLDYRLSGARFAINLAALAGFAALAWARRGSARRGVRTARFVIVALALSQIVVNHNLFAWSSPHGFHASEMFHYYVGSKYFEELGYTDLYLCSAAATLEGEPAQGQVVIRDLRSGELQSLRLAKLPGPRCDERFSPARWDRFGADVRWFRQRIGDAYWGSALRDHGYNPSPVWTAIGRPMASVVPVGDWTLRGLARLDLLLLAAALGAVAWGFGLEAACLVALLWGGSGLNRYGWIGGAFLRELWWASALIGLACLRRGRYALAAIGLSLSGCLRLFPVVYAGGAVAAQIGRSWRDRKVARETLRFAVVGLGATLLLATAGAAASGRGWTVYPEFAANIRTFAEHSAFNSIGLKPALSYSRVRPSVVEQDGVRIAASEQGYPQALQQATLDRRGTLWWGLIAAAVALFVRAVTRPGIQDWEAAALGFALIPMLTQPACYYLAFCAPAALIAVGRPVSLAALLLALVAWSGAQLRFYGAHEEYIAGSVIAVALAFALLLDLQRERSGLAAS